MRTFYFLLLNLLIVNSIYAQDQEYVVTLKNDTLHGKISISTYNGQQILIKNGKEKKHLKPYQIRKIETKKGTLHPLKIRGQYQLALLISSGYLSYYKFSGNPNASTAVFDTPILVKKTGEQLEVPNLQFKKLMSKFLTECDQVSAKFEADEYNRKDISLIISDYNQCIEERSSILKQKTTRKDIDSNKEVELNEIINLVKSGSNIENKEEVLEILTDLQAKVNSGKSVPGYLINALKEKFGNNDELLKRIEFLVN